VITRSPWVSGPSEKGRSADPHHGQGYDAAVGYALAERLGFDRDEVTWVAAPFVKALEPGVKDFDVDINQVTLRADRRRNVDLSRPYLTVPAAVVTIKGRSALDAASPDALAGLRLGYVTGSPAEQAVRARLHDTTRLSAYPDDAELRRALTGGPLDAIVVSLTDALRYRQQETLLVDSRIVGLLPPAARGSVEEFGMVLEKGSPLTRCVDAALEAMADDGTLLALQRRWLAQEPGWRWFG
jgi:polar amino acid transport system substrate-binding protein